MRKNSKQKGTAKPLILRAEENTLRNLDVNTNLARRIYDLDEAITLLATNMTNPDPIAPSFFLYRAHSALLASYRLLIGGQAVEAFPVIRMAVENTLYGFFLSKDTESAKRWLSRDESEKHKQWVRNSMSYGATRSLLSQTDIELSNATEQIYECCITYGAHPNPAGHLLSMTHKSTDRSHDFEAHYLTSNENLLALSMKTVAQAMVLTLRIFVLIYPLKARLLQLDRRANELSSNL